MLKYPWLPGDHPTESESTKFGAYWSDRRDFHAAQGKSTVRPGQRTLEAELMDWSDDITYAVHDLDDFYRVGLVPLERLRADGDERRRFFESFFSGDGTLRPKFEGAEPDHLRDRLEFLFQGRLIFDPFVGTSTQRAQLRQATSNLIGDFQAAITARVSADDATSRVVRIERDAQADVLILTELTWFYVINRPALALIQEARRTSSSACFTPTTPRQRPAAGESCSRCPSARPSPTTHPTPSASASSATSSLGSPNYVRSSCTAC